MRQAIEEGFILDVLKNYTPYKLAFKLANNGKEWDEKEVERSEAMKGLMRWVRLHPYNIAQKVPSWWSTSARTSQPLLNGHAKAMVVVGSRVEAVRWQLAIDKYIKDRATNRHAGGLLGRGERPETAAGPSDRDQRQAEPQPQGPRHARGLCHRGVPNPAGGQQVPDRVRPAPAVRHVRGQAPGGHPGGADPVAPEPGLQRAHGIKDTTYILDFVNDPDEVLAAFKAYYETAELSGVTDPNLVYDLRAKLDASGHYDDFEVERVVLVELNPKATQANWWPPSSRWPTGC
jgi:type I restriction enzyme R subunit